MQCIFSSTQVRNTARLLVSGMGSLYRGMFAFGCFFLFVFNIYRK